MDIKKAKDQYILSLVERNQLLVDFLKKFDELRLDIECSGGEELICTVINNQNRKIAEIDEQIKDKVLDILIENYIAGIKDE